MSIKSRTIASLVVGVSAFGLVACSAPETPKSLTPEEKQERYSLPTEEEKTEPVIPDTSNEYFELPDGFTSKTVTYETGKFDIYFPAQWQESDATNYTRYERSLWAASADKTKKIADVDNPGVAVFYEDLEPGEGEDIKDNLSTTPEAILGDFDGLEEDASFKVAGSSQTIRVHGKQDGMNIDLVAAVSEDEDTLTMVLLGYPDGMLDPASADTIIRSFRLSEN